MAKKETGIFSVPVVTLITDRQTFGKADKASGLCGQLVANVTVPLVPGEVTLTGSVWSRWQAKDDGTGYRLSFDVSMPREDFRNPVRFTDVRKAEIKAKLTAAWDAHLVKSQDTRDFLTKLPRMTQAQVDALKAKANTATVDGVERPTLDVPNDTPEATASTATA